MTESAKWKYSWEEDVRGKWGLDKEGRRWGEDGKQCVGYEEGMRKNEKLRRWEKYCESRKASNKFSISQTNREILWKSRAPNKVENVHQVQFLGGPEEKQRALVGSFVTDYTHLARKSYGY